ncbi:small ribosomal subunit protein mS39 isoform X2 [Hydra vulgaris]|uniref:Small ribosomal subunit protein mS39 n=1 Tax=Hydra vulgaris TaxID=6087 RepID=A0ABM4BE84_HYDVU
MALFISRESPFHKCKCISSYLMHAFAEEYSKPLGYQLRSVTEQVQNQETSCPQVKRLKRDKLTVLKVLSSTVKQIPNRPHYRLWDDVILNPRSNIKQNEILLALESGEKAADFVLEKYPHLFPLREPVPPWPKKSISSEDIEETVENLVWLLQNSSNVEKVVKLYEKIKLSEKLSTDVHNQMLEFVCFHDIPGSKVENGATEVVKYADLLYAEIKSPTNHKAHEVMILGLLKYGKTEEAFKLYEEINKEDFKGSLFFYNSLLTNIYNSFSNNATRWKAAEDITSSMCKLNITPTQDTFNALLSLSTKMDNPSTLTIKVFREMKKLKIEPSLASYYYILIAEKSRLGFTDNRILEAVLNEVSQGSVKFELQHPDDLNFFNAAMDMARYKRNKNLAQPIFELLMKNDNYEFLSGGKDSQFFGNYICAMTRDAPNADEVISWYRKVVPQYFRPRDWVYQQLFYNLKSHKAPQHVPEIYKDMVSMRIPMTERVALPLFETLDYVDNIPKEKKEEFLIVAEDATKWLTIFNFEVNSNILSTLVKIFCLCEKNAEARKVIEEYKLKGVSPNYSALKYMLDTNLKQQDLKGALGTIKMMADLGMFMSTGELEEYLKQPILEGRGDMIKSWFQR